MHLIESNTNQMRIKCEPSEVVDCNSWFALALGSSSVQYICLHCLSKATHKALCECSQCELFLVYIVRGDNRF